MKRAERGMMALMDTTWSEKVGQRLDAIDITRVEFSERAGMDRSTLARALDDDPKVTDKTRHRIERALDDLEHELGMAESGSLLTSTVEYGGAKITLSGTPSEVAQAVREILDS